MQSFINLIATTLDELKSCLSASELAQAAALGENENHSKELAHRDWVIENGEMIHKLVLMPPQWRSNLLAHQDTGTKLLLVLSAYQYLEHAQCLLRAFSKCEITAGLTIPDGRDNQLHYALFLGDVGIVFLHSYPDYFPSFDL
jgi:hypothetical protein